MLYDPDIGKIHPFFELFSQKVPFESLMVAYKKLATFH